MTAHVTVLADSSVVGSVTGLALMGCGALLVALVVAGANIWLRWQRMRASAERIDPNTIEASPMYRRYLVAAAWAGGSPRNWDHGVRPVLAELVELAMAERNPHGGDPKAATRAQLGEQLWALVDRDAPRSEDRTGAGAGRDALVEILDRVEKA
jgi:hypothetical protein